jgi:YegS/Rv2252/BmrU family lipid kinase
MTDGFRTFVIVNPHSSGGGTGKRMNSLKRQIEAQVGATKFAETTGPGHATELTSDALREGYEMIVAVGGDGTVHEVVNGFFDGDSPIVESPVLGLIPSGTGGDYRKTWNLGRNSGVAINALGGLATEVADVGRIRWTEPGVGPTLRYFVNIASFGMSAEASKRVNESSKRFGGKASFFLASLRAAISYTRVDATLLTDGTIEKQGSLNLGVVAIGQYFGGGMQAAPNALPGDGQFDVVMITDQSVIGMLSMTSIYSGKHLKKTCVDSWRGQVVEASATAPCFIEADGEVFGSLPARFEIVPSAFRMKVAG